MKRILFFLPLLLLLTNCGTTVTSPMPTMLQVMRTSTLPENHFPPLEQTITDAKAVQKLYNAALALPKPAEGGISACPADLGLDYHMSFQQKSTPVREMDLHPEGCPTISVDNNDVRAASYDFLTLFAQTLGITLSQVQVLPLLHP